MCDGTDEAKKVKRNEGSMWYAVYRKRNVDKEREQIEKQME
jgi:hypothetical protein